jgi:nitrate/nitrite transporter NarK
MRRLFGLVFQAWLISIRSIERIQLVNRILNMNTNSKTRIGQSLVAGVLLLAMMLGCAGCQTFTLTKEEWEKQQRGGVADPQVGGVVGVVGSAGYLGAAIGAAVAGVK